MSRFDECLPFTLAQECPCPNDWSNPRNFSDDPRDRGGKTMCGITQAEYDAFRRKLGAPLRDVRQMTEGEGRNIYLNSYWLPHCPQLPPGLDLSFFDEAVNTGVVEATKVLQAALDLEIDGVWGPETAAAVRAITDVGAVVVAFTARRKLVYREMHGYSEFGRGWIRRAGEIGATAHEMTQEAPAPAPATQPKAPAPKGAPMGNTVQEITDAANFASTMFAQFSGLVSIFMPAQFRPFWQAAQIAVPAALNGLATVAQQVGAAQAGAVVAAHNTAGQPNAPALSANPGTAA